MLYLKRALKICNRTSVTKDEAVILIMSSEDASFIPLANVFFMLNAQRCFENYISGFEPVHKTNHP